MPEGTPPWLATPAGIILAGTTHYFRMRLHETLRPWATTGSVLGPISSGLRQVVCSGNYGLGTPNSGAAFN